MAVEVGWEEIIQSGGDVKNSNSSVVAGYDYLDLVQGYSVSIIGTTVTCVIKVEDIPDSGELIDSVSWEEELYGLPVCPG